jgi:hypothetical protein
VKRRDFLKGMAVVPASVAAAHWPALVGTPTNDAHPSTISAVVYDQRYADCRIFAELLERQGATPFPTGGDAVSVWYGALRKHIALFGGSVAGITTDSDLSASRECAREAGLKLVYEGSHDCRTSGRLIHRLRGKGAEKEVYAELLRDEKPWPKAIANALNRKPLALQVIDALARTPLVATHHSSGHPGYLTSWLLASESGLGPSLSGRL